MKQEQQHPQTSTPMKLLKNEFLEVNTNNNIDNNYQNSMMIQQDTQKATRYVIHLSCFIKSMIFLKLTFKYEFI